MRHWELVYTLYCYYRISDYPFRLFGAEVWQTDRHRSDKRQCYGQDPRRVVALGIFLYNMDYNVMYA